jgi:acyl-CoA synthetase (NDP forming)
MLPGIGSLNPLDFGASPTRAPGLEATVVETLASDPGVDVVVVVADGQSSLREAEMEFNHLLYGAANRAAGVEPGKPLLLASSSSTSIHPTCRTETGPDVPTIRGLANALVAVRALSRNRADVGGYLNERATLIRADKVSPILQADEVGTSRSLSADATNDLLDAYGITRVRSHFVKTAAEALVAAATIGYPVVAKFLSQDIAHRSDVGGVITGISTPADLDSAISLLEQRADALGETVRIDGFEIQSFVPKAIEAMVGFVADPVFGATVAVGMGGVLVELLRDIESAPAPVGEREAHRMVDRSRLGKLLAGYRNLHRRTDAAPLVELVGRVSRLAIEQSSYLQEGDFNPVLVEEGTGRVVVVDALLVRKEAPL